MPKAKTILVRATHPDRPCPTIESAKGPRIDKKTGRDRNKIYHDEAREVPAVAFYLKRLRGRMRNGQLVPGDLEIVKDTGRVAPAKPAPKKAEG